MATPNNRISHNWVEPINSFDELNKLRVHSLRVQTLDGTVVVLDGFVARDAYRDPLWSLTCSRRDLLEHIQTQVNNQLAILALEGQ